MQNDYATYQVGLKILLQKEGKVLILRDKRTGYADLPGGRINISEQDTPLHEILDREIREELGESVQYKLGNPIVQFRRFNIERNTRVFITVYEGQFLSGEIKLSDEHGSYEWVDPKETTFTEADWGNREEFEAMNTVLEN